ncbi:methylated-DNA--protein-cysteine methyltransferase [Gammaproteobacteria bacterium]|nr:methylated-DNA--protein-cysteine methyltransferase [Gammaproteobacteria bacterium]
MTLTNIIITKSYPDTLFSYTHKTPIGDLISLESSDGSLTHLFFNSTFFELFKADYLNDNINKHKNILPSPQCINPNLTNQLHKYFAGDLSNFSIRLMLKGTNFQLKVWHGLLKINYGTTCSYLDLAAYIDHPKAVRALGSANGANPIPIIIPCHRVIKHNGKLGGYGGGLEIKQFLLDLEKHDLKNININIKI